MLKLFANRQLVRKDAETYEKVSTKSLILGALLLIGTYICMMLPIVQTNEFSVGSTFMSFITLYAIIGLPVVSAIVFISKFKQWRSKLLLVAGIVSAAMLIPLVVLGVLALVLEGWLIGLLPNIVLTLLVIVLATFCGIVALVKAGDCMSSFMKFFGASCIVVAVLFAVRLFADSMTFLGQDLEYLTYCFDQSIIGQLLAREDALNAVLVGADPLVSQMALHGSSNDLMMIYGAILFLLAATVIFVCNRYKNRVAMAVSATLNAVALVMIFSATSSLGSWDLGSGRTFSYTVAALMLLFAASILYLNVFQYIKGYGKYGFTFVLPFFLTFAIFQLYPIYFTFRTSLTNAEGWAMVLNNEVIGFDNFKKLFTFNEEIGQKLWEGTGATAGQITSYIKVTDNFWGSFKNTVIMWVFNFVPQISMALLLASWFTDTRMRLKFQGGFKVMIFMPNIITAATIGMLFMSLFGYPIAPVNTLLQNMGILNEPFEYWRNTAVSRGIVSFIQWWMWYGNTMIVMIAGILGINPSLFEAALVDGCSSRQTFWKITLPLIKPILLYNLVTSLVGGMTMFDIPHLMTQGGPDNTTNTVARFIYMQAFTGGNNFNVATAASVVLFIIIVICSLIMSAIMKDRTFKEKKRRAAK